MSPHRYAGVYDELLSPPRRSVEPPYGARYGLRGSVPPPTYPPMGIKPAPAMGPIPMQPDQPPYRGRYDGPAFEDIPPGVDPPVPGFEPPPFEKPPFGPPPLERDRLLPPNFRDPYRPPSYIDGPPGSYRDMPMAPVQNEIPVHVGDQPGRYRDNYRPGPPYRDQGPMPFREGQPFRDPGPQGPFRDPNFRGPHFRDSSYRNIPYREAGFRDNPPTHGNFRDAPAPFRPPSTDPRESAPPNFHEPNYRENYRDENGVPRDRPGYRSGTRRGAPRRNPNADHERHREKDGRERERFNENREPTDRQERYRDTERRPYDKSREGREERPRDYERNREYEKDRDQEKASPDRKLRASPKRNRDTRDKRRSESRGRSRDRDSKREKKDEKTRDKTSAEIARDHKDKDKEKKLKDRKKKKREKEKETEKKKKREKKEKKEKDVKKEDENDKSLPIKGETEVFKQLEPQTTIAVKTEKNDTEEKLAGSANVENVGGQEKIPDLYEDEIAGAVDREIIQNYVKAEDETTNSEIKASESVNKDEPFDGLEIQVTADELDLKVDLEPTSQPNKEMLAPLPALSKWEMEDEHVEKAKEPGELTSPDEEEDGGKVTSDVIKRAENAIFAKAINSLRPIEIKKISNERLKLYGDDASKPLNNIQITVPVAESEQRSIELNDKKKRYSKTPPPRLSVKERLGGKVEDTRKGRESRLVQSTVELVKSRSKTPKKEQPYRRVTVEKERKKEGPGRTESKIEKRVQLSDNKKSDDKLRPSLHGDKKGSDRSNEHPASSRSHDKKETEKSRERKKSMIDEAHFEPDYDENVESDHEMKDDTSKKRERTSSLSETHETKKPKIESETIKLDLTNVKKKPDSESESSSDSELSSSSSSSDARKRKKKKKRNKKKRKRAASESDSESDSDSDDHKKKKKKRKHKKKSSKKKKKSKHK